MSFRRYAKTAASRRLTLSSRSNAGATVLLTKYYWMTPVVVASNGGEGLDIGSALTGVLLEVRLQEQGTRAGYEDYVAVQALQVQNLGFDNSVGYIGAFPCCLLHRKSVVGHLLVVSDAMAAN